MAGELAVQRMGVRPGCPLSPTLFGILFNVLHAHLRAFQRDRVPQPVCSSLMILAVGFFVGICR